MNTIIIDYICYFYFNIKPLEKKLARYQGYGERSVISFKRENKLDWYTVRAIMECVQVLDGLQLRNHIRSFVEKNNALFNAQNTYFTHFGPIGKSGGIVLNQFLHCFKDFKDRVIGTDQYSTLSHANLIFFDDIIGTGVQASDYITSLAQILNSSVKPYLYTICSTDIGVDMINNQNTSFRLYSAIRLCKKDYFLLDEECTILTIEQKNKISKINSILLNKGEEVFNLNLPIAFYYSIPDNALPLLWKDGYEYSDDNNQTKKWYGLIPRDY